MSFQWNRGTRLGPYEIVGPLGAGGMGEVYRARDTRVGREVAVKVLPPEFAADRRRLRRFEQEARLAASLNHPNIVGLYDVGPEGGPPYMVAELVAGTSLRAWMGHGSLPLRKVLDLGAQMAEGLAAAHGAGVIHRDLKPENVMVTSEGRVKILDFGLARVQEGHGAGTGESRATSDGATETLGTSPGMVVGTVSYMSPEQASGAAVDYRSDQFSLGLVLYEMLTRRRPFDRATSAQTMAAIIEEEPPPVPANIPIQVRWTLERCLAKEAPHRYASTLDLARELRQLHDRVGELTTSSGEAVVVTRRRTTREVRILAAGGLLLGLIAIGVGRVSVDEPFVDLDPYKLTPFATQLPMSRDALWSPDGKSVAFVGRAETDSAQQMYVQRIDGPSAIQITQRPFSVTGAVSWTPDSRMIYCRGLSGSAPLTEGIFRVPVGGGDPVLVQRDALAGALSPDGKTLVTLRQEAQIGVYVASPPESAPRAYEPAPFKAQSLFDTPVASFAPNGREVIVSIASEEGNQCWLLPWPQGKARRVFEGLGSGARFGWRPDSRRLVVSSQPDPSQPSRLLLADVSANQFLPMFISNGSVSLPSVSADGARIAFTSDLSHQDVVEVPILGGAPTTVLGSSRNEEMPALSTDGQELVYVGDPRGAYEVWSRDMEEGSVRRLLAPGDIPAENGRRPEYLMDPLLSRDRRRLAVNAGGAALTPRIYVAFTAGGAPVRATTEEGATAEYVGSWSPEGDRLAYMSWWKETGRVGFLTVIRPGSAEPPARILDSLAMVLPEWSPTGEWIAACRQRQGVQHIVFVSPDGRAKRELQSEGGMFAWAPDGRTLYVARQMSEDGRRALFAIDPRTGSERLVRDLGELKPFSSMTPGLRMSVTPDGRSLVYAVRRERSEIWLLDGVRPPESWYARLFPW